MKKGNIYFIKIPKEHGLFNSHFQNEMEEDFILDPSIPLPIELEENDGAVNALNDKLAQNLSLEMILAGMLRVIPDREIDPLWLDYYRNFILFFKPDIFNEFIAAAHIKSNNRDYKSALEIIEILEGLFPMSSELLLMKTIILERAF